MLYLKSANLEDIEKEYEFITNTPSNENGFTNFASGCSRKEFEIKYYLVILMLKRELIWLMDGFQKRIFLMG